MDQLKLGLGFGHDNLAREQGGDYTANLAFVNNKNTGGGLPGRDHHFH